MGRAGLDTSSDVDMLHIQILNFDIFLPPFLASKKSWRSFRRNSTVRKMKNIGIRQRAPIESHTRAARRTTTWQPTDGSGTEGHSINFSISRGQAARK